MVASSFRTVCTTMSPKSNSRALNIDRTKDYSVPLQVETSVEYDLPSHIYPPKGSEPILMVHPSYTNPFKAKKVAVTSQSPTVLSSLQVHDNYQRQPSKRTPISKQKHFCSCGNPTCRPNDNNNISRTNSNNRGLQQQTSVLNSRQISSHSPKNNVYSSVNNLQSTGLRSQQKQPKAKLQKQLQQVQHYKYIDSSSIYLRQLRMEHQLQQAQLRKQIQDRANAQPRYDPNRQTFTRQTGVLTMSSYAGTPGLCFGPCCFSRIGAFQGEFLAPGLPSSLLSRTPTRGSAEGSPKVRTRTRRGVNVAQTVNLPEYLGTARSSRTSSLGGATGGSSHSHNRTQSSSMPSVTPAPITANQVTSALDVVRAQVATPRSLFASSKHQLSSAPTFLSTVGQSRDSGCSLSAEIIPTSAIGTVYGNENISKKNKDWPWTLVDSGFCTPVETNEDHVMEAYDATGAAASYTPVNCSSAQQESSKDSGNSNISSNSDSNLHWMKDFSTPLTSASSLNSIHHPFLSSSNPHYIPQPIWNLVY